MGLLVAPASGAAWPDDGPDLLRGRPGAPVDRSGTTGGALGFVDYGHPVFEMFAAPRSGDLTGARIFRYRQCAPAQGATVIARFDDGAAALAERRVGAGTVLTWTSIARQLLERPRAAAGVPPVRPPGDEAPGAVRGGEGAGGRSGRSSMPADQSMSRGSGLGARDGRDSATRDSGSPDRCPAVTTDGAGAVGEDGGVRRPGARTPSRSRSQGSTRCGRAARRRVRARRWR